MEAPVRGRLCWSMAGGEATTFRPRTETSGVAAPGVAAGTTGTIGAGEAVGVEVGAGKGDGVGLGV